VRVLCIVWCLFQQGEKKVLAAIRERDERSPNDRLTQQRQLVHQAVASRRARQKAPRGATGSPRRSLRRWDKRENPRLVGANREFSYPGNPVAQAVPSALEGFTAVFGMGTGVSPPLRYS